MRTVKMKSGESKVRKEKGEERKRTIEGVQLRCV